MKGVHVRVECAAGDVAGLNVVVGWLFAAAVVFVLLLSLDIDSLLSVCVYCYLRLACWCS